jgi:multidrug efflux pump
MRHAMGVAVFSGMLGVTFFGLVLTPVFYVVIQGLVERRTVGARQFAISPAHDEDSDNV